MEQQLPIIPTKRSRVIKSILLILTALIIIAGVAFGVYVWQRSEATKKQQALQSEIATLKNAKPTEQKQDTATVGKAEVYYETGGLTLRLPSKYVVIVNVEGNKGGAPGATLRIGEVQTNGSIKDNVYNWAQIDIDHTSATIDQEAGIIRQRLIDEGYEDIVIANTTFRGLSSKVITGKGMGYAGQRRIYVVKSGEFVYGFTSQTGDASKDDELLSAIIAGSTIVEKSL